MTDNAGSPVGAAAQRARSWLEDTRAWADQALEREWQRLSADVPERLEEAMRYALFGGGKRLRPALVRAAGSLVGGGDGDVATAAVAVEWVHTYSLVHDDLPCMDDDDLRRGRPTCHKVYGEALAVLVGDALQAAAFELLGAVGGRRGAQLTRVLAAAAGARGMVGGQQLDLASESLAEVPGALVEDIHRRKTAALIAGAVELGVVSVHADWGPDEPRRRALRRYGEALGLCFQAVDDVLDVTGDAAALGKTPGKDAAVGKATLVAARGLEGARNEAQRLAQVARDALSEAGYEGDHPLAWMVDFVLDRDR